MACRILSTIVCKSESSEGFTICISEGRIYSFGKAIQGAHGHSEEFIDNPKLISTRNNITSISAGNIHTLCLDSSGNVYTFGSNFFGQLGIGKTKKELLFTSEIQKLDLPSIQQISTGDFSNYCLSVDGDLYSFGLNNMGQLGNNGKRICTFPETVELPKDIDFIESGSNHAICKTIDNNIYVWGNNQDGQLGIGRIGGFTSQKVPLKTTTWPDGIVDIKCGLVHTIVLTLNQEVYSCGWNNRSQLGRDVDYSPLLEKVDDLSQIIRIECGSNHSLCIDIDNNLYIFGDNENGQLGLGDTDCRKNSIKHPSLLNIIDISKGGRHTFVKTSSNEIYAFGSNKNLQLGIKTKSNDQLKPIQVFQDKEDIWSSNKNKRSTVKSARFISKSNSEEPPKKKSKIM